MNTQATEGPDTRRFKEVTDSFFHRHRQYFFGLLSGAWFGVFAVEAFRHQKNPLLYWRAICDLFRRHTLPKLQEYMTLRPNYLLAFGKTFVWFFIWAVIGLGVVPYLRGKGFHAEDVLGMSAFVGLFFGIFVAVFFTPREITFDDERFKIRALYPGSGEFMWRGLEAWNPWGRGTFLIKFQGEQAYQIAPFGYWPKEWKAFRSWIQEHFPEKRTLIWFGVRPVRFGKRDDT